MEKSSQWQRVPRTMVIVEVLSKSTADYDRGDKFFKYRQIPELKEYVLIDQYKMVVEVYFKPEHADLWKITRYESLDDIIKLESVDLEIEMRELYFDIEGVKA